MGRLLHGAIALFVALAACAVASAALAEAPATSPPATLPAAAATEAAVLVTDLVKGVGDEAFPGMVVIVHYTGWLYDPNAKDFRGRQFDSSRERGQPFSFHLGSGHVIRGWEQGIPGMKVGGTRRLVIPPELAYGSAGAGNGVIPPGATLLFEVELLAVETVTLHEQQ
ncbi:MAG TPA: FKBP-type peptidyl-prolyl cis-trans isomerase [Steroidobacteraceae bacterium]|jgi:FKBP-type peptidyl-prolyl cis-trans isomerase